MKSYYGNLMVDIFEFLFAIVSLLLVWVSYAKDSILFFGITAIVYMLPRFLSIILHIVNNGIDLIRYIIDLISLIMLFISFGIVCLLLFNQISAIISEKSFPNVINLFFYFVSAVSLTDIVYRIIVGIVQKFSVITRNTNTKSC